MIDKEIIGEASNLLPDEIKDKYPTIEWHRIRGSPVSLLKYRKY